MEYAATSNRSTADITRAVRNCRLSRRMLATLNKRRRERGLSEIVVPDTLAEAGDRAAAAAAKARVAAFGR